MNVRHFLSWWLTCALAASAGAQTTPHRSPLTLDTIARGVIRTHVIDPRGPWDIHIVRIELRRARVAWRHERANHRLVSRETVSEMAARVRATGATVLAAINADFFDLATGASENNVLIDGEWWKGVRLTESPYDTYDNIHAQFALSATGHPMIDRFSFDGWVFLQRSTFPLITLNTLPRTALEGATMWTPRYGPTTPRDSLRSVTELALAPAGLRGDTSLFIRRSATQGGGLAIPADGAVLSAYGLRAAALDSTRDGDTIRVTLHTAPRIPRAASLIVGGWPRILRDGQNLALRAPADEGTLSRNAEVRHPRTAIGFSRDSTTVYWVTVDGRSATSVGMTLYELADYLRSIGAWQALNFDGGGSTTMVVRGRVVNTPSDKTGERAVGSALLLVERPQ